MDPRENQPDDLADSLAIHSLPMAAFCRSAILLAIDHNASRGSSASLGLAVRSRESLLMASSINGFISKFSLKFNASSSVSMTSRSAGIGLSAVCGPAIGEMRLLNIL